ncbi:MAG: caspase family protein [Salinivirgaceae bacterium]|jgi:WD40 repeat protein|nr:caspase family protein [Salinivirgaceae bacterium]
MRRIVFLLSFVFIAQFSIAQIAPEIVLTAKKHKVWCIAYSTDGKYLASGGDDGTIIVYKTDTYGEIGRFSGLKDVPISVCFSHDGKKLAAGGKDNKVTIWDLASHNQLLILKGHKGAIVKIEYSPDDKLIATASYDKTIKLWNAQTGQLKSTLKGHTKEVNSLSFSPNGDKIASGSGDKTIKIWDVASASLSLNIPAHTNWVRTVVYSPDGSLIASGGDDRQIHLWDAISGNKLNTFKGHKNWISSLDFSPDGNYLISGCLDNILILTDIKTGKMVFQSAKQNNKIIAVDFNPNGQNFAFAALLDPDLQVWNTSDLLIKPMTKNVAQKASSKSGLAPKVEWVVPTTSKASSEASIMIKTNITTESSLRKIELYVNNQLFNSKDRAELMMETAEGGLITYEELVILNDGENSIQVKAKNIVGEASSSVIKINYSAIPVELISWIQPATPVMELSNNEFLIKANINKANSQQEVSVLSNGVVIGTYTIPAQGGVVNHNVKLNPGDNAVSFRVKTSTYTKETESRVLHYSLAEPPEIVWQNPVRDLSSFISAINIKAQINSKIPIDKVEIQVNGLSIYTKQLEQQNTFTIDNNIQVAAEQNIIKIIATNKSGESVSTPKTITYQAPEKTNISWTNPSSNAEVYNSSFELKACIQSKTDISAIKIYSGDVLIHSEENPSIDKTGECAIELSKLTILKQGENNFRIDAENLAGTTQSVKRVINYVIPQLASVNWVQPNTTQTSTSDKNFNLKACIQSNTPILNIDLIANSQIISSQPQDQNALADCTFDYEQLISLNSGNNTVMLKIKSIAGEAISQPLFIDHKSANPYRFALIIGNEDYSSYQTGIDSESNVDFAINDARKFKETCQNQFGIKAEKIVYLENARQMEMVRAVNKLSLLIKASEGKAEVLVFYAGHGFPDEKTKEPFLIPVDVSGSDLAFGGGIKLTQFYELLTEYPAVRVTVFLDACFSGGARNQGLIAARGVKIVPKETKQAVKKKLIVFTASSGSESSLPYKDKQHGMFTYYLLKKLNETKGTVSYKELSDYLKYEVNVNSLLINNKEQQPQTNISEEVGEEWKTWRFNE